ncbi:MAG: aldo/keto reductase [Myxococcales bacterium]|nr:aldo/keto reductase [Myxococcales bacterium]
MKTRALGVSTGISVSAIGLGCMPLSLEGRPSKREAIRVLHAAFEAGVSLVDTADVYCIDDNDTGHNERLIAAALAKWPGRAKITVATKGGLVRPGGAWICRGNPRHLRAACEASLKALGVDAITLYQLHAPDDDVPLEESVGALADLRREGKIQHIGLSNVGLAELRRARAMAPIVSVQNRLSIFDRQDLRSGLVDACAAEGLAYLAYGPVGGMKGKVRTAQDGLLRELAEARGVSTFRIALAWLLERSPSIIPIPGATRAASIVDSAAAADLELTGDERARLDAAFPVEV